MFENDGQKTRIKDLAEGIVLTEEKIGRLEKAVIAEVALLDKDRRRVKVDGEVQTVLVSLGGGSREEARSSLTSEYEFVRWV